MDYLRKVFSQIKNGILNTDNFSAPKTLGLLTLLTLIFNISSFNGGKFYQDSSIAALVVSANPKLNPKLAEKLQEVKLASENQQDQTSEVKRGQGNIFLNTAYAVDLTDDDLGDKKPFEYEVQGGDTLSGIAEKYQLRLNTILWANNLTAKTVIRPGQKLTLLPIDGVLYTIKKGDTIGKIASLYKADSQVVLDYNDIADATKIHAGDAIIIPDGQPLPEIRPKPVPPKTDEDSVAGNVPPPSAQVPETGKLLWPTTTRNITQKYSARHRGIDISDGTKPPIFAAQSGTVEFASYNGDWGNTILIRGDDGLVTRYSHASEIDVAVGDHVSAGNPIGVVGNTGRVRGTTGLHLDFRVYKNGVAVNPLKLLY